MIAIREAAPSDASVLAELTTQLGYPSSEEQIADRLPRVKNDGTTVFVAENGGFSVATDFGTSMPVKSWEESIPSVIATARPVTPLAAASVAPIRSARYALR